MTSHSLADAWSAPVSPQFAAVRFLVGVDGGGTGTRVRLSDVHGRLLGQGWAGPSALGQGIAQAWRHIQMAVQEAAVKGGIERLPLAETAIGLGLSGAGVAAQAQAFIAQQPGYAHIELVNDGTTSVIGAHAGRPGGVIAAGTGTVGEALRADGAMVCVSGWGWIGGDEGSGAWLGIQAMRVAQKAMDGRAAAGPLAQAVWGAAGCTHDQDRDAVNAWVAQAGQHAYAQLAPLVFEHMEADPAAAALVAQAVAELEQLALALDPSQQLPLSLAGSVAQRLAALFSGNIRARCVSPQGDSADGALRLVRGALSETR
ncbi:BadF/BadG/BcrA/BcrD ATPase family protein [Mitsuaria sp. GD03876]|uniref:BadF/BadG/BcrA/BcrD ATPase family protein n=1 Tax=Mitsuaria sp. GD03876 TaxID=2975399 RepID=UPI00244BD38E|nr:BadF/BadG/BcrA/BcrD ATPase family protein [Mitsuaria sp. GD03876]MDH0864854.1 ATPase [Mitsuaria sp. GD03876]